MVAEWDSWTERKFENVGLQEHRDLAMVNMLHARYDRLLLKCVDLPFLTNMAATHSEGSPGVSDTKTPSSLAARSEENSTFNCCLRKDGKCGKA